ncbi:ATP-grasp domain-containing protein [Vibrio coralliilyticus]|uniref:ATP-grasp domain-containing protein n=1 Tax=Vibrio coralliilyticus TaxID=190893 RepID=UPI000BAAC007|nr:ATP-grasp domain-containing protein [Vibrio coralliilyticus]NOI60591.1 ATP-grasp domain-containing protein [Vibrio coralliilyticus]PAT65495.1 hypothetical protein CKA27_24485 [Vibrio coralliilyticus]
MKVLIIGGVVPYHQKLMENDIECILLTSKEHSNIVNLNLNYSSIHVLDYELDSEEFINIAVSLHSQLNFDRVCAFHEQFQKSALIISSLIGTPFIPEETIELSLDKEKMRQVLRESGLDNTNSFKVENKNELYCCYKKFTGPVIIKPVDGTASESVYKINSYDEMVTISEKIFSKGRRSYIIEDFFHGDEYSIESFSERGNHKILAITEKIKYKNSFVEKAHIVPASLDKNSADQVVSFVKEVLTALKINDGPSHLEIILGPKGPMVVESHCRAGGDGIVRLLEDSLDIDVLDLVAKQSVGMSVIDSIPDKPTYKCFSAVWFYDDILSGVIDKVEGVESASTSEDIKAVQIMKKAGDVINHIESSYDRVACVFAVGSSRQSVEDTSKSALRKISFHCTEQ